MPTPGLKNNVTLDAIDWKLLVALQENGRLSYSDLARNVGLSAPAVSDRVRRLEAAGIIRGYRAELDIAKLGYPITAVIRLAVPTGKHCTTLLTALAEIPEVLKAWRITGAEKSGWKPGKPEPFLATPFGETPDGFSPDGRWLAYTSNESGTNEVYVRPYPGPGGKWQISTGGGRRALWSRNGKELFYETLDQKMMVVKYSASGESFRADKPSQWSPGQFSLVPFHTAAALHPDGKRFVVIKNESAQAEEKLDKVTLIENFFDELRRLAPAGKK